MDMASVFAPITKSYEQDDGSLLVEGIVSDASLDLDQQRCDPNWLKKAVPQWFSVGNLREQHDEKRAIGKAIEHQDLGDGGHFIRGRVVDPVAVAKTKAGIFTGFSIGVKQPRISKSVDAPGGVITDGRIVEVSLVDVPCNSNATLTVCKAAKPGMELNAADFDEERGLVRCEELVEKSVEVNEGGDFVDVGGVRRAVRYVPTLDKDATVTGGDTQTADEVEAARNPGDSPSGCGCCNKCVTAGDACCDKCMPTEGEKTTVADVVKEFNRDEALALVKSILKKADGPKTDSSGMEDLGVEVPPVPVPEELDDIHGAKAAIAIIAQLIIAEAQEMVCAPNEDLDILCLMQAVAALREFIRREKGEPSDDYALSLAAEADATKAKYSADELRQMLSDGKAIANANGDPSYPIGDKEDLANAIRAVGRGSGDHDKIRAYIIRRAKALGCMDMIPDNWTSGGDNDGDEGSSKAATIEWVDGTATVDGRPINHRGEFADKAAKPEVKVNVTVDGEAVKDIAQREVDKTLKAVEPETTKAATVESDPEALVKALTAALEKADNPLRKSFTAMIEAATEDTAKSVTALTERLSKVEAMATPGGPALRRSDSERKEAAKADLLAEAARYKALANSAEDRDLRSGYAKKAATLEAQIKALAA